nr:TetR/AcrR family transcriptional regulator [uncultured Celeribacter sp.]
MAVSTPKKAKSSLRFEQQQETRRKLVQAAFNVFSENGYRDATIQDITREAGASRATFYIHFNNKAEVIAAAWQDLLIEKMIPHYRSLNAVDPCSEEALSLWFDRMLAHWEEDRNFAIASNQALSDDPALAEVWVSGVKEFFLASPDFTGKMRCGPERAKLRFLLLCSQLDRIVFHWLSRDTAFDRSELVKELTVSWMNEF